MPWTKWDFFLGAYFTINWLYVQRLLRLIPCILGMVKTLSFKRSHADEQLRNNTNIFMTEVIFLLVSKQQEIYLRQKGIIFQLVSKQKDIIKSRTKANTEQYNYEGDYFQTSFKITINRAVLNKPFSSWVYQRLAQR